MVEERKTKAAHDLPSLHMTQYSTCLRPRRKQQSVAPSHFRNKFMRFVEYPDGVFIKADGKIDKTKLGIKGEIPSSSESESDDDVIEIPRFVKKPKILTKSTDDPLCVVCLECNSVGVFESCLHQCCCMRCGPKLEICPICRTKSIFIHNLDIPMGIKVFK